MLRLVIIDEKGKEVDPSALTDTGLGMVIYDCDRLKEQCEELHYEMFAEVSA
jgi:hypothetical protein